MKKRKIFVVPHSHYDAEVFTTREETLETGHKIILDVLNLIKIDKTFKFVLDQVALIKPFLEKFPEQESFFRQMVKNKRLEICGGMYVMPDVNIPNGESLVRQILLGKRYCQEVLQTDVRCGWMIDTFGHHPQMPQIMKKSDFDYYVFARGMKTNNPSEFYWQGIDSTKIVCHWMPFGYTTLGPIPKNVHQFYKLMLKTQMLLNSYAATDNILVLSGHDLVPPESHLPKLVKEFNSREHEFEVILSTPVAFFAALNTDLPTISGDLNPVFRGCYSARIEVKQ